MRHKVTHSIKSVKGICGIDTRFHKVYLDELGIPVNSLMACDAIYSKYKEQYTNEFTALLRYKGIVSKENYWIAHKFFKLRDKVEPMLEELNK